MCVHARSKELDSKKPVDIVYLDFERAFDKVPHQRLLTKLDHFGIRGTLFKWIGKYLKDRTFQVRVGDSLSQQKRVLSGVPQGSVLAPHLFGIFITYLADIIDSASAFFADDCKFFADPSINSGQLQDDLNRIQDWTKDWIIKLNPLKCSILHLGSNNPRVTYNIDGNNLASVNLQRDLGVNIAFNLKWEDHITSIVKKANSFIYVIRRSFQTMTVEVFRRIYKTYIRPLLEYGYQLWSPYFQKDIDLLESVQRKATKMPQGLRRLSYNERLVALRLTTLEERRLRGDLIESYKILTHHYNLPNIQDILLKKEDRASRGHRLKLVRAPANTNVAYHFFSNRVVHNWNMLPEDVVSADSVNAFKNKLDNWLRTSKTVLKKVIP